MLDASIAGIKGIGPRRAELLGGMGLFSASDVVGFLPSVYKDYSAVTPSNELVHGRFVAVRVEAVSKPRFFRMRGGAGVASVQCGDDEGALTLIWFNQPYAIKRLPSEGAFYACGRVDKRKGVRLLNPVICSELPGIVPEYALPRGLSQKVFRGVVAAAFAALPEYRDPLPEVIRSEFGIPELRGALYCAHFPSTADALDSAKRRLAFEDMLRFVLMTDAVREKRLNADGIAFECGCRAEFLSRFGFVPTAAQLRVMDEIESDMKSPRAMNRLVQGDVGSGKTFLALYAMYIAAKNGFQSALMAPTEILAQQHFMQLEALFGSAAALLTGGMPASEVRRVRAGLADGSIIAVAGTHSLFSKTTEFCRLGLVVTDEQHRFGVRQRASFSEKGSNPDLLVMSATPIPRTLALLMYGDLDCSVVDELPAGRTPVETRFVRPARRKEMYKYIASEVEMGRQAYIVCPMIDRSENVDAPSAGEVYEELKGLFCGRAALLHGRMSSEDKRELLNGFRSGAIGALVSTTVIEVGMDVANASIMVIEAADRYGLSQLHQLRGRVGRGAEKSYCFLLSETDDALANERIRTLISTSDGFAIAEKDLTLRGPGQFLGQRQHGLDAFFGAGMAENMAMLSGVRAAARRMTELCATDAEAARYIEAAVSDSGKRLVEIAMN